MLTSLGLFSSDKAGMAAHIPVFGKFSLALLLLNTSVTSSVILGHLLFYERWSGFF